ncbi:MAG: glycosyltransferase family 4 protein [Thermodesulfobacteriota bacterium]
MKYAFIYLTAFSSIGGIQKFNKLFLKVLCDISDKNKNIDFSALSLHDEKPDKLFIEDKCFKGCKKNRLKFFFESLKIIFYSDVVILGHINLYLVAVYCLLIRKKFIIVTHGIEVWKNKNPFKNIILKRAHKILSVSNFTKDKLVHIHNVKPEKIAIVFNSIDPSFIKSVEEKKFNLNIEKKDDFLTILTVCRMSSEEKYKGYDKVIEAIAIVKKKLKNIKYIIVGSSDNMESIRLKELIKRKGLEDNVKFSGEVLDSELIDYYLSSDIFAMPSKGEGFGIVFLEALLCGLPVIAGNQDGSSDPLMNGELGSMVDPDNIEEIAGSIINFATEKKYSSEEYKKHLNNKVIKNFGYETFKENIANILS